MPVAVAEQLMARLEAVVLVGAVQADYTIPARGRLGLQILAAVVAVGKMGVLVPLALAALAS
jgi:hypothetical protein